LQEWDLLVLLSLGFLGVSVFAAVVIAGVLAEIAIESRVSGSVQFIPEPSQSHSLWRVETSHRTRYLVLSILICNSTRFLAVLVPQFLGILRFLAVLVPQFLGIRRFLAVLRFLAVSVARCPAVHVFLALKQCTLGVTRNRSVNPRTTKQKLILISHE
jgi:hypothetical protein